MTKQQAHKSILEKFASFLISEEEARKMHQNINRISASNKHWSEKEKLYSVWAA